LKLKLVPLHVKPILMVKIFHHYISKVFICLFIIEFFVFFAAMHYGSELRFLYTDSWYSERYIDLASLIFAITLSVCFVGIGLYRRSIGWSDYELLSRTAVAFSVAIFIFVSIYYVFPEFLIARSVLAFALIFAFSGMILSRLIFKKLIGQKALRRNILVIGSGKNAQKIIDSNKDYIHKGFQVIGCLAIENEPIAVKQSLILNDQKNLVTLAKQYQIDEIVIALDDRRSAMPVDELLDCKFSGIEIIDLLSFFEREKAYIDLDILYPSWIVFSDKFAIRGLRTIIKKLVDITMSLILLVLTFPIMLLTTLAICIESGCREPIFYRQTRVGAHNKPFEILKFRSMTTDAEKHGIQFAKDNDARITRVGSFIRKCRIDELPQIFNVLNGKMSFVGPRPERPEFVAEFDNSIPYYTERHRVKPGITGWAQLRYPYGENEYDAIQKLQYDLYYVKNYSLFLDLTIIIHTIEVVLWGKGSR
jgi:sugar transferase (PEP-CTERM system associated)